MDSPPSIRAPSTTAMPSPRALFSTLFSMRGCASRSLFSLGRKTNDTRRAPPLPGPRFHCRVSPHKHPKSPIDEIFFADANDGLRSAPFRTSRAENMKTRRPSTRPGHGCWGTLGYARSITTAKKGKRSSSRVGSNKEYARSSEPFTPDRPWDGPRLPRASRRQRRTRPRMRASAR